MAFIFRYSLAVCSLLVCMVIGAALDDHVKAQAVQQTRVSAAQKQSAIAGAKEVYQRYSEPRQPPVLIRALATILSNKTAAYWGLSNAQMSCADEIVLYQAQLRDPKAGPPIRGEVDGVIHLFRKYGLVDLKKEKTIPIDSRTPTDLERTLKCLPESFSKVPPQFLQHGRQFLADYATIEETSDKEMDAWDKAHNLDNRNPLPPMYGIRYGHPPSVSKLLFIPKSPTEVEIRTKDPKAYIDSQGDASLWIKSFRAVKEDGKWYIDIDPDKL